MSEQDNNSDLPRSEAPSGDVSTNQSQPSQEADDAQTAPGPEAAVTADDETPTPDTADDGADSRDGSSPDTPARPVGGIRILSSEDGAEDGADDRRQEEDDPDPDPDIFKTFYKKFRTGYFAEKLDDAAAEDVDTQSIRIRFQSLAQEFLTAPLPPFCIYCAEFDRLALTLSAGFFRSQPATLLRLDTELVTVAGGDLDLTILVKECEAETRRLVIDARRSAKHHRFWERISSTASLRRFCDDNDYQIILLIGAEDLSSADKWAAGQNWSTFQIAEPGFENDFIITVASEQDERLSHPAKRQELARRTDRFGGATQLDLLDALLKGEVSDFVTDLEKDYEQGRAGQRESVFRQALLDPDTKNPGQASALFVGAFFPNVKRSTFLQLNRLLHEIAMSVWKPQKLNEATGELEEWDPLPSDQDRNVVGVYFEAAAGTTVLQSRLGGSAAMRQYQDLFSRSAPDALTIFVDNGLIGYPILADDDQAAHEALVKLTVSILEGEFEEPLRVSKCRQKILDLALTQKPYELNRSQRFALRTHTPLYLVDVTQRLSASRQDDSQDGETSAEGLKLLLSDLLEISRRCEGEDARMEWLHDIIVRTAILSPNPVWDFVFGSLYERKARLRQRWFVTNGLWSNLSEALRGAPARLNALLDECLEKLDLSKDPLRDQQFRLRLCSRLLILWLSSLSAAQRQLHEGDAEELETAKRFCETLRENKFTASGDVAAKSRELSIAHEDLRQAEFEYAERTRGSELDRDVFEQVRQDFVSERSVRTTSLVILEALLPMPTNAEIRQKFLDALQKSFENTGNGVNANPSGFGGLGQAPTVAYSMSDASSERRTASQKTSFEQRERFWLSCLPLALIFVERSAGGDKQMLIDGLRRAANPKAAAGLLHKQIGDLKNDFQCASKAAKGLDDIQAAKALHAQLVIRYQELDEIRKELVNFGKDLQRAHAEP